MTVPPYPLPVTRRLFLEKSLRGTTALAFSGLAIFAPPRSAGAEHSPHFIDIPSPQFPAWTPDGNLLITFIAPDGSYGLSQIKSDAANADSFLSVGTAIGQFNWPQGIAVDGSLAYIVDGNNGRIQRFDFKSRKFLEPFGGLGKKSGLFVRPRGICVFEKELFVADTRNHRIQVFSMDGVVKRVFGELGDADEQFRLPASCAVSAQGEVFVVDSKHALVKVFDLEGSFKRKFGGLSQSDRKAGTLNMPAAIALNNDRDFVCVADTGNSRVQAFDLQGRFLRCIEAPGITFNTPQGLAWLETGEMAISDPDAGKVWITMV